MFTSGDSVAIVSIGILSNYLRIIELDNSVKSRCSVHSVWDQFISGVMRCSIYHSSEPKTSDDIDNWLMNQVAPSFATLVISNGGDLEMAYKMLSSRVHRLNAHQQKSVLKNLDISLKKDKLTCLGFVCLMSYKTPVRSKEMSNLPTDYCIKN